MPLKFNPFSGTFDQTGSGGTSSSGPIDGEVPTYNDLSLDVSVAPLNSSWLVRTASGSWFTGGSKPAGIYVRTGIVGSSRNADFTYAGLLPSAFADSDFKLYNNATPSKTLAFDLSGITASTTRTLTVPNASGTLALVGTSIGFDCNRNGLSMQGGDAGVLKWNIVSDNTGTGFAEATVVNYTGTNTENQQCPIPFQFFNNRDITVTYIAAGGYETLLVLGDDYTVSGGGDARTANVYVISPVVTTSTIRIAHTGTTFIVPAAQSGTWAFNASCYFQGIGINEQDDTTHDVTIEFGLYKNNTRAKVFYSPAFDKTSGQGQVQLFGILPLVSGDAVSINYAFFYNTGQVRNDPGVNWFTGIKL